MNRILLSVTLLCCICLFSKAQNVAFNPRNDSTLFHILSNHDSLIDKVINNPSKYNFQLIYTRINRNSNKINISTFSINEGNQYYNPASLIKFPLALVALEKMTSLKDSGISILDSLVLNTCSCDYGTNKYVSNHKNPTLLQFLREMMIMSNNNAYNLFFDFIGRDVINTRMKLMGIENIQMKNRFTSGCSEEDNQISGGLRFKNTKSYNSFLIPCLKSTRHWSIDSSKYPTILESQIATKKTIINNRKNNSENNYVSLMQAHKLMINLMIPSANLFQNNFIIDSNYKNEFIKALGSYPRELENSEYDTAHLADYYYKFFIDPSIMQTKENKIRVYNKVGLASGFVSDVSYFFDSTNNIEYFISGALLSKKAFSNENNYNDFGIHLLRKIGGLIYKNELDNSHVNSK